jgi:methenyltetrahydrofolate cyclohydrolase
MLRQDPFSQYLDALATARPTPGGGSAAAVTGALGAALISMVCNLTLAEPAYAGVHPEVGKMLAASEQRRAQLAQYAEDDACTTAWLIPLIHEMQRAAGPERSLLAVKVQEGLKSAAATPLATLEACAEILQFSERITEIGNTVALSDSGMAAAAAEAGMVGAALTVEINLGMIEDKAYVAEARTRVAQLTGEMRKTSEAVIANAYRKLAARSTN